MICASLNKSELKIARLTCRSYEQTATPLLFDQVFLSTNRADFEVADETIRRFQPYIKTLVVSSVLYEMMSWTEFKEKTKDQCFSERQWKGNAKLRDQHIRYTFDNYRLLCEQQSDDLKSGVFLANLCRALQSLPSLQRIAITDGGTLTGGQMRGRGLWVLQTPCPVLACNLSDSEHLLYQLSPLSGFHSRFQLRFGNPWDLAILAMWTTNLLIKDIAVEARKYQDNPNTSLLNQPAIRSYLSNLVNLRLGLMSPKQDENIQNKNVAQALSAATHLQSLFIELRDFEAPEIYTTYPITRFSGCFDNYKFAELRSLILSGMDSRSHELLSFLRHHPQLRQLTLNEHRLKSGRWKNALDQMQNLGILKNVEFNNLRSEEFDDYLEEDGIYRDYFGNVEAFFFENEPNPFTRKALEKYILDLERDRPWKYQHGGLGPEARYRLFH